MPNFEVFTKKMVPLAKAPSVTINRRGTLSFNKAAHVAMGSPDAVELLFDRSERIIGVRKASSDQGNAYHVRSGTRPNDGPYFVTGGAFCRYYNVDTDRSRRWTPTFEDEILMIDLNGKSTDVTSNRSGSRAKQATGAATG